MQERGGYTIKEVAGRLGVSPYVVRRLCNTGLVPQVRRAQNRYRVLTEEQVDYARVLLGLRQAGLSNAELRKYTGLYRRGEGTLVERKAMMETQKRQLWQELEDKRQGIDFLERQIELIDAEMGRLEHEGD